ncbi:MAG: hypothetical protein HC860_27430 [Alkalinema sp. RU_4_3]|nr:hypothetical protein [Alkalinema sp. RU_4_3]
MDTLGVGLIHRELGDAYLKHISSKNLIPQWCDARRSFWAAINNIPATDYPQDYLSALWGYCKTSLLVTEINDTIATLLRQATDVRDRLLTQAPTEAHRDRSSAPSPNLNELTVDFLLTQNKTILALETAEADKNGLMQWLLTNSPGTTTYPEMRQMLVPKSAIVYWYLSTNTITTFILRSDHPEPIVISQRDRIISMKERDRLDEWIKTWNKTYADQRKKSKANDQKTDWYITMPTQLETLAEILHIPALLPT